MDSPVKERIHKVLQDAKVSHVSKLVGKPIEVTVDQNSLVDWRILTEVL